MIGNLGVLLGCAAAVTLAPFAAAADFSYYILSLSYAPEFCGHAGTSRNSRECGAGRPAFVVHGLWPERENGRGPERCAPARPVAAHLVRTMLNYMPTASLIQHEWATHGTCSGLSAAEYFAAVRRARDSLRIPQELERIANTRVLSPAAIEEAFHQANPGIPREAFRVSCYPDGGFREVRICFDKQFAPRPCTGVAECRLSVVRLSPM